MHSASAITSSSGWVCSRAGANPPMPPPDPVSARRPRVVIVGGGFGGLAAAHELRRSKVDVTLVDRKNHQLFQPLLYQVAAGGLAEGDCASSIRAQLRRQANATVMMAEVTDLD